MAEYPKRASHFAHKLTRLMLHSCAAQDIGTDGVLLVLCIAHCEDAKRYTGPVTYWNEQLMPILGFNSWGQLDRARRRAVESGWLHYECGGKRSVGRYWTLIPEEVCAVDDCSTEADYHVIISKNGDKAVIEPREKWRQSGDPSSLLLPSTTGTGADAETALVEKRQKPKRIQAAEASPLKIAARKSLEAIRIVPTQSLNGTLQGIPDAIETAAVAAWWRGHIGGDPLTGDTALDLLHVLCSAAAIRKSGKRTENRSAKLAAWIAKGKWVSATTDLEACYAWMSKHIGDWIEKRQESVA